MRKKLYKYSVTCLAIVGLIACSKAPDGILNEKKMKDVMVDMYVAEGMISNDYQTFGDSIKKDALYQSVFRKHNITQAVYDSSLVWYAKNLDVLMKVYDLALDDINERVRALGDVQASAAPTSNQDSVNIWPRRDYLVLEPKALFNGVVFNIIPDKYYSSGSGFVLGMRVWGITDKMRFTPEVRISIDQGDTTIITNKKITREGYHQTIVKGLPTKQVRRVYGYIRMDNTDTDYFKVYVDSLNLMKYNYRSPAMETLTPDVETLAPDLETLSLSDSIILSSF